ncbi:MAG TPA: glycoside hydrolase family 6 protein [Solirubrobacteraceae bacterium]|nr:glycoside hydrolase family 6 protein [Solirubrobacteraceae bacterium]
MSLRHVRPLLAVACLALMLTFAATGRAAAAGTVSLDQAAYTVHENQGSLAITIVRSDDLSVPEHVGYGVKQQDAQDGIDFHAIPNTYITIPAGQSTYTFSVPIIDRGINGTPVHALAYLYGSWPDAIGTTNSLITILHDDPLQVRDATNPLGIASVTSTDPLVGAQLFVDPQSPSAQAAAHTSGAARALLDDIAQEPGAHRFWMWNMGSNVAGQVAHWLGTTQLEQPGSTVMMSSYNLVHGPCGSTATPAVAARYHNFMQQMAAGIGNFHVVYFLEFDSLITTPCLTRSELAIREGELRDAVSLLEADPHVVVYLDGGAADAIPARRQAALLRASGVAQAQGFFLNSTHFDWTSKEIHYGQEISRMLGGAHFVINTGENGRGPLVPRHRVHHGNEVLCNPPGRGLGPLSLSNDVAQPTGYTGLDGLLWFSNPGGSGGQCVKGAPPTGTFWPKYAEGLARHWVNTVSGPHFRLLRSR